MTDALGHATSMTYDALDRVTKVTDAEGHVTTYQYDRGGRVKAVTDPRQNTTSYTYDGFGQLWERSSPDTGTTTYSYADDGHLQGMARADGIFLTYTYDTLGRPTSVTTGTQTRYMVYDNCTHGIGRICSVSDADSTTAYAYDPQGDITQRTFTVGTISYALGYSYDGSGRLATLTYPDGNQASYAYQNGRLSGITATVNGSVRTVAGALTYREGDRLLTSWTAGNGLVNNYTYDGDGRLTGIVVQGVQDLSFDYDDANRITSITNGMHPLLTQGFTYDDLGRLIQVDSPSGNESYTYDANGNRTSQTVGGVRTPITVAADSNQLVSVGGQVIGYDANGNVTKKGGVALYHYDSFNRLRSAGGATYTVNPEGQRLRKAGVGGTTYFAPGYGGKLLAERPDSGWVDYVYLGGHLIGSFVDGQVYAFATDQVGRPEVVTNANQTIVWQAHNKAFCREVPTEDIALNLGFPGQYHDDESGLWYNGFRDYNAKLGRYIESDPIGLMGGLNTYAYVGDNPINSVDLAGLCPCRSPKAPPGANIIKDANDALDWNIRGVLTHTKGAVILKFAIAMWPENRNIGLPGMSRWDFKNGTAANADYCNYHYGYVGAAAGFSLEQLEKAAGAVQYIDGRAANPRWGTPFGSWPYGDDPMDEKLIREGFEDFFSGPCK